MAQIVIKFGTQVVTDKEGNWDSQLIENHIEQIAKFKNLGNDVLLVSSGAIGIGRSLLSKQSKTLTISEQQACAAVGQSQMIKKYSDGFSKYGIQVAQVLVTAQDFSSRNTYLNIRHTLEELFRSDVIPILNENDTVSVAELSDRSIGFGDNDKLSALVAGKLGVECLFILSSVDGIYDKDPELPSARLLSEISSFDQMGDIDQTKASHGGRGGVQSKLEALRMAAISGVTSYVGNGKDEAVLKDVGRGELKIKGTRVHISFNLNKKKQWIGFSGFQGIFYVNPGAHKALVEGQSSLLAKGATGLEGSFKSGDVVSIQSEEGVEIGRGVTQFSSEEANKILGCHSRDFQKILGRKVGEELVHRDHLVIFEELPK